MPVPNFKTKSVAGIVLFFCLNALINLTQGKDVSINASAPLTRQTEATSDQLAQALVPEGVLAMRLAETFKLATSPDVESAVTLLSALGIEPQNGWITEYPVTPKVLGELEIVIASAIDLNKLALPKDQALALFTTVKQELGLNIDSDAKSIQQPTPRGKNTVIYRYVDAKGVSHFTDVFHSIPEQYRESAKKLNSPTPRESTAVKIPSPTIDKKPEYQAPPLPNPQIINRYYRDQGPPIITYYEPPETYTLFYSWVAYPFWSSGYLYPGYFVLNNFHRRVTFNQQPYFVTHHTHSNHHHSTPKPPENSRPSLELPNRPHSVAIVNKIPSVAQKAEQLLPSREYPGNAGLIDDQNQEANSHEFGYVQPVPRAPVQQLPMPSPPVATEYSLEKGRVIIQTPQTFGGVESNRVYGR